MITIPAIYDHGILRLLAKVDLPNRQRVLIALFPAEDDVPTFLIDETAAQAKSFDFLSATAEDIYHVTDGEPI